MRLCRDRTLRGEATSKPSTTTPQSELPAAGLFCNPKISTSRLKKKKKRFQNQRDLTNMTYMLMLTQLHPLKSHRDVVCVCSFYFFFFIIFFYKYTCGNLNENDSLLGSPPPAPPPALVCWHPCGHDDLEEVRHRSAASPRVSGIKHVYAVWRAREREREGEKEREREHTPQRDR